MHPSKLAADRNLICNEVWGNVCLNGIDSNSRDLIESIQSYYLNKIDRVRALGFPPLIMIEKRNRDTFLIVGGFYNYNFSTQYGHALELEITLKESGDGFILVNLDEVYLSD
ncbi:hypothetical protein [Teredinibacter sp. KSP-S5-2]|uniref:hypothetical protein n=1 Tax=Teredinibacter sp. KSP-S5-2 TaxID=3034506 RepID=UPI002935133E|nr:hypothetical protein [Teredinibacter sp. KSP-S5-2]WNO08313.1 hypothetical protein P5V12_15180 [Teredinibacter sp. KSP-S5-2]